MLISNLTVAREFKYTQTELKKKLASVMAIMKLPINDNTFFK